MLIHETYRLRKHAKIVNFLCYKDEILRGFYLKKMSAAILFGGKVDLLNSKDNLIK